MIPKSQYKKYDERISYVTRELLENFHTEKEVNQFLNFMCGQTMMRGKNGEAIIYATDYERWLHSNKPSENDGWD